MAPLDVFANTARRTVIAALLSLAWTAGGQSTAWAKPLAVILTEQPGLFDPETGLRLARYNAPTPDDIPGARRADAAEVRRLIGRDAIAIDVSEAEPGAARRATVPNAIWLPEVGEGLLFVDARERLATHLKRNAEGDLNRPVVVFAETDLWTSWNAARRIASMGSANVYWYPEGVAEWRDMGWALTKVRPATAEGQ
ncbi:MAG: PQQ-dependent catabolism-associated CXXCW motif protein [Rhodobacteraceae bacterium]|nr:PQQ-dependent catabolism-associated CXXCW motif protein [Paracoccaceae bacterium]